MKIKKSLVFLAVFMVSVLAFSGCSGNGGNNLKSKTDFSLNEEATLKTLKITAVAIEESQGEEYFEPEDGNTFVGVKFEIENTSSEAINISSLLQFSASADDVMLEYSFNAAIAFDDGTLDGTVNPGKKLIGWYAVEVNEDWETLEIKFVEDILYENKYITFTFNN